VKKKTNKILLFKKRKVDKKLRDVNNFLKAEMILASEQRIGTFGLKGNFEDFTSK